MISSTRADADSFFDDPLKIQMTWGDDTMCVRVHVCVWERASERGNKASWRQSMHKCAL